MTENQVQISPELSDSSILEILGDQLRQRRLSRNLSQAELGTRAGVARSTISEMEKGHVGTLQSFVQVLRALQGLDCLNALAPVSLVSPIQVAKERGNTRQRASRKVQDSGATW